jgi:Cd2+/Zn2+-exporting ATPase
MTFRIRDNKFRWLLFCVALSIVLETLSLMGFHLPMPYAPFFYLALILGIGYEVVWNGFKALFTLRFSSINLLMLIAVFGAFYLEEYPEAAVVIVLYSLGERLEEIGIERSKSALDELVSKSPKTATLKDTGKSVAIETILPGTIIQVKPHDMIPLDGVISMGETSVDEATITGEPIPKDKRAGDNVFAGTLNRSGYIEIKTTKSASDTTFAKIIQLTFQSSANKSETQKFIQKFARYYTPSIIVLATLLLVIPVVFLDGNFDQWLLQAITLLVIACPCALVISTPVAIFAAIGNASAKGALVKGGKFIEAIGKVNAICLDKTRTITFGNPIVSDVIPMNGTSREELLACAAGTELFSEHPLAQAIVNASRKEGFEPHAAEKFQSIIGKGAIGKCLVCEDETVYIGKLSFIKEHQPVDIEAEKIVAGLAAQGKTSVVVSFGNGVAGIIGLMDEIKPDSANAINEIQSLDVECYMLTGDSEVAGRYVASQVNISYSFGGLMPEDKATRMKELVKKHQYVAMVGDGVNDAPALALSTVGIAMGAAGSDTAIETADIALMNDKLSLIPFLIRLGRKTISTIRINTIGAIAVKIIFIVLALMGFSNLALAITADVGVTIVVILLSLRLRSFDGH